MQVQHHPRYKKRIPCEFDDDQGHHLGMVLNVSQGGLFVSSRSTPSVGSKVVLHLSLGKGPRSDGVPARVVWKRKVHRSASVLSDGGIGLEILEMDGAGAGFERLLQELVPGLAKEQASAEVRTEDSCEKAMIATSDPNPELRLFCVRAALVGTPRTRSLQISAADDADACARALDGLGLGWEILEVSGAAPAPESEQGGDPPRSA